MVFRVLLSVWFLLASVFAPAFCCCAPFGLRGTAQAETVHLADAKPADAKEPCPHCKHSAPAREENSPGGKHPCPSHPAKEQCPCKDRAVIDAATDPADIRAVTVFNWLPDFLPVLASVPSTDVLTGDDFRSSGHTGPPPLSGVELLHRLHILIC